MREVSNQNPASSESKDSMRDYYQLQWELLVTTLILTAIFFAFVWYFYSLAIALNYLLGACTGVVYLKVLARNVEQLGTENSKVGKSQIALFVGVIIVATQWKQLQVLPIFLGFLTYKAALLIYMLRILMPSDSR
ncbi:MAG: ATP synthase subunit I [Oscillatoriales cyanobacterium C42_A2020_001]|nr:ATP synthase subunit I [Leptolyngbyaceae cyanobacterium C42_A2020_001]